MLFLSEFGLLLMPFGYRWTEVEAPWKPLDDDGEEEEFWDEVSVCAVCLLDFFSDFSFI